MAAPSLRHSAYATIAAIGVAFFNLAEVVQVVSSQASDFNASATAKPEKITYGPQRKGKGGKVKKW